MNAKLKKTLKYALLLAVVAVLLFLAFRGVSWTKRSLCHRLGRCGCFC